MRGYVKNKLFIDCRLNVFDRYMRLPWMAFSIATFRNPRGLLGFFFSNECSAFENESLYTHKLFVNDLA